VGFRAGLDDVEKRKFLTLPGLKLRPLSHPARNQSLYRLRYPGSDSTLSIQTKVRDVCSEGLRNIYIYIYIYIYIALSRFSNYISFLMTEILNVQLHIDYSKPVELH
jgi:hypothetical protein